MTLPPLAPGWTGQSRTIERFCVFNPLTSPLQSNGRNESSWAISFNPSEVGYPDTITLLPTSI